MKSINRWLRPDGSGYIVKNRYPIESHHGYERYSAQSQYNLLACWLMAVAYLYADDTVNEKPCPADVGGFVVPIIENFHKIFANVEGNYIEYESSGDLSYNPTGLIRCHLKGSNPQLGPSDGTVQKYDKKTKQYLGGENMCIGPAWVDETGKVYKLADYSPELAPKIEVVEENNSKVKFRVIYEGDFNGVTKIVEVISIDSDGITVEDMIEGKNVKTMRVYYPMLVYDGLEETKVEVKKNSVELFLWDGGIKFTLLEPKNIELNRTGIRIEHRNGMVEGVYADIKGTRAVYRIVSEK